MTSSQTAALDQKVLKAVRAQDRPASTDEVVAAVGKDVNEADIVESIWRLVRKSLLEFTATRQVRIPDDGQRRREEGSARGGIAKGRSGQRSAGAAG